MRVPRTLEARSNFRIQSHTAFYFFIFFYNVDLFTFNSNKLYDNSKL